MYDSVQALDGNCVLHAANITTNTTNMVPTGWIEREATSNPTTQSTTCRSRPCEDTEMCFPTYTSPFYTCHPVVAECQAPSQTDGIYSNVTLLQGQRTNFTCNSSLVWVPRHADKTVTCQVTGKYSELKGTCVNTTYYSPEIDKRCIIYTNLTTQQVDLVSNNINLTNATYLEILRGM
ncbi:hypothetical protein C0Q70_13321 [Pomacea canaliculata]|uniref:Sushi domain-containing protein n=1 Tax=Pomacea canaliculata TaxID=400727 RepID=A0A2T7NWX6_POMCA|nr:hypothetical protein C0Q70_13321 [Pomacea canaliculata]